MFSAYLRLAGLKPQTGLHCIVIDRLLSGSRLAFSSALEDGRSFYEFTNRFKWQGPLGEGSAGGIGGMGGDAMNDGVRFEAVAALGSATTATKPCSMKNGMQPEATPTYPAHAMSKIHVNNA